MTDDERALLVELANYIIRLEEGSAKDLGLEVRENSTPARLRRLLERIQQQG